MKHNWTGLLIEPLAYDLMSKNRKAKTSLTCLALEPRPPYAEFDTLASNHDERLGPVTMAGIVTQPGINTVKMQCMPLYSFIMAAGNPTVNYLILDIEGAELQVLRTLPWDKVDIEVLSVETDLAGIVMEGSRQDIIDLMKSVGYTHREHRYSCSTVDNMPTKDDMFVRNDIYSKIMGQVKNKEEL